MHYVSEGPHRNRRQLCGVRACLLVCVCICVYSHFFKLMSADRLPSQHKVDVILSMLCIAWVWHGLPFVSSLTLDTFNPILHAFVLSYI